MTEKSMLSPIEAARKTKPGNIPEATLVALARIRDEAAIRELVRRLNPRLFRVARGIMNNDADAEEIVQEAYLNAFHNLSHFREEASFVTWVTRITVNAARMRLRTARPLEEYNTVDEEVSTRHTILPFPGSGYDLPDIAFERGQLRNWLESAVAELPENLRLVFLLKETEGMSVKAIAHDLRLNPITVKTRLFRARRRLRGKLERKLNGGFESIFPFDGVRCANMADRIVANLKKSNLMP